MGKFPNPTAGFSPHLCMPSHPGFTYFSIFGVCRSRGTAPSSAAGNHPAGKAGAGNPSPAPYSRERRAALFWELGTAPASGWESLGDLGHDPSRSGATKEERGGDESGERKIWFGEGRMRKKCHISALGCDAVADPLVGFLRGVKEGSVAFEGCLGGFLASNQGVREETVSLKGPLALRLGAEVGKGSCGGWAALGWGSVRGKSGACPPCPPPTPQGVPRAAHPPNETPALGWG